MYDDATNHDERTPMDSHTLARYADAPPEWAEGRPSSPEEFIEPLLTCGHFGKPIFHASSQWDFPEDAHTCPTCGEERQFDLRLQIAIREWWREENP